MGVGPPPSASPRAVRCDKTHHFLLNWSLCHRVHLGPQCKPLPPPHKTCIIRNVKKNVL